MQKQRGVIILAGGRSTRMGTNKALLRLSPGGLTVIEQVVSRLGEAGLPPDLLITNTPHEYAFLVLPIAPDDAPGAGPLGGILTALNHSPYKRVLVVACDMPMLNPMLLRYMASLPGDYDALIPRWTDVSGRKRLETLHAIYSRGCIGPISERIKAGDLKVAALAEDIRVRYLEEGEMRRYDPGLQSFRNVNTPEDWEDLARDD
ncbi:MAG TPA: molybdenum cofactor guanylyltransferase [Chloroflexia bacterium]